MVSSVLMRVAGCLLLVCLAARAQDADPAPAADAPAADDSGANPSTRFLPGIGNLVNNIFNPCSRCNAGDQQFANRCCQTGERNCCFALQPFGGGGFNSGFNGGFGQGGFGQGGFGQGGFGQGGFGHGGQGGFGHGGQGGFGPGGFNQGGFGQGGFNNFQQNTKAGFCPKPGLFGGLFSRSAAGGAGPGARSGPGLRSLADAPADAPADEAAAPESRRKRQTDDASAPADAAGEPNTRFLPNPFGPGPLIQNPFCRDECFNDFDCPGNLKCCLRDCRKCLNPSFF